MISLVKNHMVGFALVLLAIAYLVLHKYHKSTFSKSPSLIREYPNANVEPTEEEQVSPEYLTINQPTKKPIQTVDISNTPMADNFSPDNLL